MRSTVAPDLQAVARGVSAPLARLRPLPATWTRAAVGLLCLLGLVLRALTAYSTLDQQPLGGDAAVYLNAADVVRHLALGGPEEPWWRREPLLNRGPLYPALIAVLGGGVDRPLTPLLATQVALGGLTCLLVYLLGAR